MTGLAGLECKAEHDEGLFKLAPRMWQVWDFMGSHMVCVCVCPQELRSLLQDLIPELILSKKYHIHMGPIPNGSGVMSF